MPKLSIITINFNDAAGLEKTIQSVINQSFQDYEFIIVDGGSSDSSVALIKKHSDKIKYWVSEKDTGIYNAQNKGLKKATGEFCLFLNSGDFLADKDVLMKILSKEHAEDIIYGDMKVDWGNKITTEKMHPTVSVYEMYKDTIWHPVSFIKRSLFEMIGGYDENYKIVADYEFFFRAIVKYKVSTKYVPIPVSVFAFNGLSSKEENKKREQEERRNVWNSYLSPKEIESLEEKWQAEVAKKKTFVYRILNKLKL